MCGKAEGMEKIIAIAKLLINAYESSQIEEDDEIGQHNKPPPTLAPEARNSIHSSDCIVQLKFFDKEYYDLVQSQGDKMKRAGGKKDRDFIEDLQNGRYIEPEISAEIVRKYVDRVVEARKEFNRHLEEAGIVIPGINRTQVSKSQDDEIGAAESEGNQWLTESDTSDNVLMLSSSDTNDTPGIYPETVHSA